MNRQFTTAHSHYPKHHTSNTNSGQKYSIQNFHCIINLSKLSARSNYFGTRGATINSNDSQNCKTLSTNQSYLRSVWTCWCPITTSTSTETRPSTGTLKKESSIHFRFGIKTKQTQIRTAATNLLSESRPYRFTELRIRAKNKWEIVSNHPIKLATSNGYEFR